MSNQSTFVQPQTCSCHITPITMSHNFNHNCHTHRHNIPCILPGILCLWSHLWNYELFCIPIWGKHFVIIFNLISITLFVIVYNYISHICIIFITIQCTIHVLYVKYVTFVVGVIFVGSSNPHMSRHINHHVHQIYKQQKSILGHNGFPVIRCDVVPVAWVIIHTQSVLVSRIADVTDRW